MSQPHTNRVRASDAEREEVAARLRTAMSEGRLTLDEGEQRLAAVYAVTYRDELPELTADLPPAEAPRDGRGDTGRREGRGRRFGGGWRGRPAVPVLGLVVGGAVLFGLWAVAAGGPVWPVILLGILAIMMVKHGRRGWGHWSGHPGHPGHPGYRHGHGSSRRHPCHRGPEPSDQV